MKSEPPDASALPEADRDHITVHRPSPRLFAQSLGAGGFLRLQVHPLETQPSDPHPRPAGVHRLLLPKTGGRKLSQLRPYCE